MNTGKKYGLDIRRVPLNLALILKGNVPDLQRIVDKLEKENGILVVYKKVSSSRFSVIEE